MGALVYQPEVDFTPPSIVSLLEIEADLESIVRDVRGSDMDRLIALGRSPQGARPKVLLRVADDGSADYGDRHSRTGCTPYLVRFRECGDEKYAGSLEHACLLMAVSAGINVPATTMLGRTRKHPGYFAIQRFDRDGARKLHLHTFASLINAPHSYPSTTYQTPLLGSRAMRPRSLGCSDGRASTCLLIIEMITPGTSHF